MERVATLINKLKEQFDQHADADKLAVTAQLLLSELQKNQPAPSVGRKISVVLPSVSGTTFFNEKAAAPPPVEKEVPANNWLFDTAPEIPTLTHQSQHEHAIVTERKE